MEPTHKYTGPTMKRFTGRGHEPLNNGDKGTTTGGKRGGLMSFIRTDGVAFWVVPGHLQHMTRAEGVDE